MNLEDFGAEVTASMNLLYSPFGAAGHSKEYPLDMLFMLPNSALGSRSYITAGVDAISIVKSASVIKQHNDTTDLQAQVSDPKLRNGIEEATYKKDLKQLEHKTETQNKSGKDLSGAAGSGEKRGIEEDGHNAKIARIEFLPEQEEESVDSANSSSSDDDADFTVVP